jgi:hypothetical protein
MMLNFLRTGSLGGISLGMRRTQVETLLGEPDDWGPAPKDLFHAPIWKYGSIELYFAEDDLLEMIFADDFPLIASPALPFEVGIISHEQTLDEMQDYLTMHGIPFESFYDPQLEAMDLICASGVRLRFYAPNIGDMYQLSGLWISWQE